MTRHTISTSPPVAVAEPPLPLPANVSMPAPGERPVADQNLALDTNAVSTSFRRIHWDSPIGVLRIVSTPYALTGIYMEEHSPAPSAERLGTLASIPEAPEPALLAIAELTEYFAGNRTTFTVPRITLGGTDFQRDVWQALTEIPYAETVTYGEIAEKIGRPSAVRAVGAAVARNPLCLIVPCHRVLGSGGTLTGYAGGVARKAYLLQLEDSHAPTPAAEAAAA